MQVVLKILCYYLLLTITYTALQNFLLQTVSVPVLLLGQGELNLSVERVLDQRKVSHVRAVDGEMGRQIGHELHHVRVAGVTHAV